MKFRRALIWVILIFAIFIPYTHNMRSHTINGYPSRQQETALKVAYDNAQNDYTSWKEYIAAIDDQRDLHVDKIVLLYGAWSGTQSAIRNQQISALTGAVHTKIITAVASAFGIAVKMATAMYSSYSLEDLLVYEISQANLLAAEIDANWGNVTEAYNDWIIAKDHWNSHLSQKRNVSAPPIKPSHPDLPKFPCGGSCGLEFDTPDSPHHVRCGTARNVEGEALNNLKSKYNDAWIHADFDAEIQRILNKRSASDGCGRKYYNCTPSEEAEHQVRTCKKTVWERPAYYGAPKTGYTCNRSYRRCMGHLFDHDPTLFGITEHDDSGGSPSPTVVDKSPDCDSCTTGGCSSCPITYACGVHSGPPANASAHSMQASCSKTNGWGHACTATGFYACQTHTCTFPTFACGNRACSVRVADREEHRRVCMHGHKYWSCNSTQLDTHKTRGPCTRWVLRQKWNSKLSRYEGEWVICGESWAKCDRNGQSCQDFRGIRFHQE